MEKDIHLLTVDLVNTLTIWREFANRRDAVEKEIYYNHVTRHIGMKFSLFREYGAQNSKPVFDAFANSLVGAGHDVVDVWCAAVIGAWLSPSEPQCRVTGLHILCPDKRHH